MTREQKEYQEWKRSNDLSEAEYTRETNELSNVIGFLLMIVAVFVSCFILGAKL